MLMKNECFVSLSVFHEFISTRNHPLSYLAIISHPDAGKTTLTEKLLWFGGATHVAGEARGRRAASHATSDWMELENSAEFR